jgi:hypothetical protein
MRLPKYLSHSSVSLWEKDVEEFYRLHLCETRTARLPQANYMAIGSAFDAYAKSALHEALFGKGNDPAFEFQAIFEKQVEPHNRDWGVEHGKYVFECYVLTGAFQELLDMLSKSKEAPRFEFDVNGMIGNAPVLGKPDCKFVHESGVSVVLDWKVKGYCSEYGASPSKHYRLCRDAYGPPIKASKSHNTAHAGYTAYNHNGFEINTSYMEASNEDYANQLCVYGWLLGETVGDESSVVCIDEVVGKYMGDQKPLLRVANHRSRVSREHQMKVFERYQNCWNAISGGHIFQDRSLQESQERCAILEQKFALTQSDGTALDNYLLEASRPAPRY